MKMTSHLAIISVAFAVGHRNKTLKSTPTGN